MEFRAKPLGCLGAKLREVRYYRVLYELSIELILGVNAFSGICLVRSGGIFDRIMIQRSLSGG